ncbi:hypothetical protein NU195Hw_Modified_356t1 [Hortaea werneckii]
MVLWTTEWYGQVAEVSRSSPRRLSYCPKGTTTTTGCTLGTARGMLIGRQVGVDEPRIFPGKIHVVWSGSRTGMSTFALLGPSDEVVQRSTGRLRGKLQHIDMPK